MWLHLTAANEYFEAGLIDTIKIIMGTNPGVPEICEYGCEVLALMLFSATRNNNKLKTDTITNNRVYILKRNIKNKLEERG